MRKPARNPASRPAASGLSGWRSALPAGIALSFGHTIEGHLFAINAWDPLKFALAAGGLGLGVAALAGCWVPARRAAAVDPIEVMRQEMRQEM
jgi:hypothetical protein